MKALIFDTETTGLIENMTVHLDKQPHVIEFYGQIVDLSNGEVSRSFGTLVKPPIALPLKVKGDRGIAEMTGISEAMLVGKPPYREVADQIRWLIEEAPAVIAHNLSFDMDMITVENLRLKSEVKWPTRKICTVEQTLHLKGHRLNLTKMYNLLFPGEEFVAHRAENDVKALTRCCVELFKRGII